MFFMTGSGIHGIYPHMYHSWGAASSVSSWYMAVAFEDGVPTSVGVRNQDQTHCIGSVSESSAAITSEATLQSLDSDGFTLNWTTTDASSRHVGYLALGGDDIQDVAVGAWTCAGVPGNQSVTGVGFKPTLLFTGGMGSSSFGVAQSNSRASFGMSNGLNSGACSCVDINGAPGNSAPGLCAMFQNPTDCLVVAAQSGNPAAEATLVSLDSDGFTLNFSSVTSPGLYYFYVALNGHLSTKVGSFNQPTSTGNQSQSGLGFKPAVVFFQSYNHVSSGSTVQNIAEFAQGMSDGNSAYVKWAGASPGATNTVAKFYTDGGGGGTVLLLADESTSLLKALATLGSFDKDGFTLNWAQADATAREILYFALGSSAGTPTLSAGQGSWGGRMETRPSSDFVG